MTAKILKFWHQWSWVYHIMATVIMATVVVVSYQMTSQANASAIFELQQIHKSENMATRMAVQENTTKDVYDRLGRIEIVQGKIFDRLNQIADRR